MKKIVVFCLAFFMVFPVCIFSSCQKNFSPSLSYEIVCEYRPEHNSLNGTVKVEFKNQTDGEISALKFNLYPNAYRKDALFSAVATSMKDEVYYRGESYGGITVSSVLGAKGWDVEGEDENILVAELESPLYTGEKVVIDIGFTTRLPYAKHRLGVTDKTVNLGHFYPILCALSDEGFEECVYTSIGDPFISDTADYLVQITLPKEYTLASAGEIVDERTLESKKRYTVSALNAREFAAVLSTEFAVKSDTVAGKEVKYYYLSDAAPEETLQAACSALAFYSSAFGEYAYLSYTLVETPLPYVGVEYSGFTMLAEGLGKGAKIRSVAHETAHGWWYAAVGSNQVENAWQDEGLAEYSAALFFEKHGEYGQEYSSLVSEALSAYREYHHTYLSALGWVDLRMSRPLREYLSEYEYSSICIHKSVVMFDCFKKSIGEKKLLAGLKKYYTENKFKVADTGSFIGAFERVGVDAAGFFDGFLNGKEMI